MMMMMVVVVVMVMICYYCYMYYYTGHMVMADFHFSISGRYEAV